MTGQQERFINAYFLNNCNATRAAKEAGYANPNMAGARLKSLPAVREAIKKRLDEEAMPANEVLYRLGSHARVDMADFWDFGRAETEAEQELRRQFPLAAMGGPSSPRLDLARAKTEGNTPLIKTLEQGQFGWKVTLVDSQAALNTLARHHRLLTDRTEVTGAGGAPLFGEMTDEELDRFIAAGEDREAPKAAPPAA